MSAATTNRLFGTDGIRAEAGKFPLDHATVRIIGASLAEHLAERTGRRPAIVIGRDTRESGGWIASEFNSAARAAGAEVHSAGIITTPGVAFLTRSLPAAAGVVVSASHNSFEDNGIKIFDPSGRKLDDSVERIIENDVVAGRQPVINPFQTEQPDDAESDDLQKRYLDFLTHDVAHDLNLDGFQIVVDCANGAAYKLAPELFRRLKAHVHAINIEPNGRNINLDCGSLHLEGLRRAVLDGGAQLGVAYDGDADRALFVDETGNVIDGDGILWILANYFKSRGQLQRNKVVATVMTNMGLEVALRKAEIELIRTAVGDKYVLDELLKTGASLGGEQSGHIIFPGISLAGDGMITTILLLRVLNESGQAAGTLARGFPRYPQLLVNVRVREKVPFDEVRAIREASRLIKDQFQGRGRVLLRYSGTEPLARIMLEGEDESEIREAAGRLAEVIQRELD